MGKQALVPVSVAANSYKRGDLTCKDFEGTEKRYNSKPTDGYAVAYAICLLARNGGEDLRAVHILEAEISLRSHVSAADILALYKATGAP